MAGRKEELDDLIAAFSRQLHEKHPNPERVGCPGRAALTRLATEPAMAPSGSIVDHLRNCAACLDESKELRLSIKGPQ
jgi:hypothetical protein